MENQEEEKQEEEKQEPVKDIDAGDTPKTTSLIESASTAAQRLEEANKKKEELLAREEELMARKQLGGTAEAGQQSPEVIEETPQEYAAKVMKGEANPLE